MGVDRFVEMLTRYNVLDAFWATIQLTVYGAIGALVLGTIVAIMRVSPVAVFSRAAALWTNVVLYTPLTLIAFFFAFGVLIKMNIRPLPEPPATILDQHFAMGVVAIAVYHSSLVAEALRSGINTVPLGQAEAARAIGLDFGQSLREVILPQAFRGAIVPLGNALIALTKNTTVAVVIGVMEMAAMLAKVTEDDPGLLNQAFSASALAFVALTLPTGLLVGYLGKKLAVKP